VQDTGHQGVEIQLKKEGLLNKEYQEICNIKKGQSTDDLKDDLVDDLSNIFQTQYDIRYDTKTPMTPTILPITYRRQAQAFRSDQAMQKSGSA